MLEEKVLETINKYHLIEENDHIILGVSGGPDSTCLFHIFLKLQEKLNFTFVVCHINHGIRQEAILDEQYVEELCKKYHIPYYVKHEKVLQKAEQEKMSTEEMGRKIRYEFFHEILKKEEATKIATAHTKNDLAETVLMNLLRGTGVSGLKGIEAKRDNIIRPLIECERGEIENYCKQNNLDPKIDKTNFENIYTRNKIRNELIPYLQKEFNPNIINSIARMSSILTEEDKYLEKLTCKAYKQILIEEANEEIILDLKQFNQLDLVIKDRIVLYTITRLFGSSSGIEKKHIEDIIKLCSNNIGNKFLIPNKKIKILVKKQKIFFISNQ
ncbi:MAG: tRNA lysidine(34) synthetase TilS [Clostridia bacterium]|nr:tRNA lysidine(34) synthetase TilS [Clostridia bacterium]